MGEPFRCRWWGRLRRFGGSGGGTRTRDTTIMSRVLYPPELPRRGGRTTPGGDPIQSPFTESNRRPSPYHGDALPTELKGQRRRTIQTPLPRREIGSGHRLGPLLGV